MAIDLEAQLHGQVEEVQRRTFHAGLEEFGQLWWKADEGDMADIMDATKRLTRATHGVAKAAGEWGVPAQGYVGQNPGVFEGDGEVLKVVIGHGKQAGNLFDEDDVTQPARA